MDTKKHTLTEKQAHKMGLPAGTEVDVTLYTKEYVASVLPSVPLGEWAKDVYFDGRLIGRTLRLDSDD